MRKAPVLIGVVVVLAAVGAFATFGLPASLFPAVDFPRVVVSLDAGDQPAEQMEVLVTRPIEQAIRRVPGVTSPQARSRAPAFTISAATTPWWSAATTSRPKSPA